MDAESDEVKKYVDKVFSEDPERFAEFEEDIRRKTELCKGQEEKIAALPMEDTIWFIKEMETVTQDDGITYRYLCMVDRAGMGIGVTHTNVSICSISQHSYDLLCFCTLFPMTRQARRPRMVTYMDKALAKDNALDVKRLGIKFVSPGLSSEHMTDIETPWMRECSICRRRGTADLFKTCSSCQAVIYCSRDCQKKGWSLQGDMKEHSHKVWCAKMKHFMSKTAELTRLPFTFAPETTAFAFNIIRCEKFLEERGVYNQGLWRRECTTWATPGHFIPFGELPPCDDPVVLPVESCTLDDPPANTPPDPSQPFTDWESYYEWRGLRLDSPVAVLLNFPLTLYYILTTCLPRDYPGMKVCAGRQYVIDLVGVEKEVEMLQIFKEFGRLLPDIRFMINMVGTEISKSVDLKTYKEENVSVTIHRSLYHKYKGPHPHLVLGFNAGVGAYMTWAASLKKMKVNNVAAYFTDYCQYSCDCARLAMEGVKLGTCTTPEINPFRSPFRKVCEENNMPWYSNGFIYRLVYEDI
ncbi:zinc finger MYND domain-containing protein 15-like [Haliotis rufescens]|uniref:zinc finger MYND domain-containing protein 15-like n=1 Tax=Haliotis rufescens TaxID=6454 RepID=UPI00201E89DD|nr:zinc finger MYND domain-containing protein 15-like [Haliotis rufescens]XP_048252959.1 zinc finger MYND domain-containing protein 15-like [Haliotis rufescens]